MWRKCSRFLISLRRLAFATALSWSCFFHPECAYQNWCHSMSTRCRSLKTRTRNTPFIFPLLFFLAAVRGLLEKNKRPPPPPPPKIMTRRCLFFFCCVGGGGGGRNL